MSWKFGITVFAAALAFISLALSLAKENSPKVNQIIEQKTHFDMLNDNDLVIYSFYGDESGLTSAPYSITFNLEAGAVPFQKLMLRSITGSMKVFDETNTRYYQAENINFVLSGFQPNGLIQTDATKFNSKQVYGKVNHPIPYAGIYYNVTGGNPPQLIVGSESGDWNWQPSIGNPATITTLVTVTFQKIK